MSKAKRADGKRGTLTKGKSPKGAQKVKPPRPADGRYRENVGSVPQRPSGH